MAIYNLIEYTDNYSEPSGSLRKYYKDESSDNLADSESLNRK